jgi:hypothetical protein
MLLSKFLNQPGLNPAIMRKTHRAKALRPKSIRDGISIVSARHRSLDLQLADVS